MKAKFPKMKELFFDDDTFTADPRARAKSRSCSSRSDITWSTNSRANVDYETLKILKDGGLRLFVVGYEMRQRAESSRTSRRASASIARAASPATATKSAS